MAIGPDGRVLFQLGDVDRPFFYRSAIKPFQATIVLEAGVDLSDEELAVAISSHAGQPAHVAIARSMLGQAGLASSDLRCPEGPALIEASRIRLLDERPDAAHYTCSGKHAAMLMACVEQGWAVESYVEADHPGQLAIYPLVEEVTGQPVKPVGVDGCGYPTLRGSVRGMARAYARLMFDERFRRARRAMMRFPALVGGSGLSEVTIADAIDGVGKTGAAGLLAIGAPGRFGLAVKSFDGSNDAAAAAAAEICVRLGATRNPALLTSVRHRPISGGRRTVGRWEPLP